MLTAREARRRQVEHVAAKARSAAEAALQARAERDWEGLQEHVLRARRGLERLKALGKEGEGL
jgi:hypothetical protein